MEKDSITGAEKTCGKLATGTAIRAMGACSRMLHFCSKFSSNTQGLLMRSGRARISWRGLGLLVFFATVLGVANLGAQQPSASPAIEVKPASQAAVSSTPPPSTPENKPLDSIKQEDSDQIPLQKLGPGDLLEVGVYNVPELTTKARVNNSGDLYLPLIDYVHVEGLTQDEAQNLIQKRLEDGGFVRNPHVTIFIDEAMSQGVTILGEVNRPGIYPDTVNHRLYEVISEAGGFSQNASRKIAVIRRSLSEPIHIDLPRNLTDDLKGNVEILPGDTINVPKAPIIYVVGDVGRPSGLLVENGELTVLQALALSGGTNRTAKMSGARIIRKTPTGLTETRVQLKKMLEAKAPDVNLQADDILFVPVSGGRVLAGKTIDIATAAATAVTIYTVHP
jgi:polysaccharide biosynthesis/export protein